MTTSELDVPAPTAPPAEQAGLLDDIIEIWYAPSKVFARRADAGFFLMMCIITAIIAGLFYANRGVMQAIVDAQFDKQIAEALKQNPNMDTSGFESMKAMGSTFAAIGVIVGTPLMMLVLGLVTWLTGKSFGAEEFGYGQATMISVFAYWPKVAAMVAVAVEGLLVDTATLKSPYELSLGVGRFMDPEASSGLLGLVGRMDVFTLWTSLLLGIGISVVGKVPRSRIVPAAIALWVLGAVPSLWSLLMETLRGG